MNSNNNEFETLSFDDASTNTNPVDPSIINDATSELKIPVTELNNQVDNNINTAVEEQPTVTEVQEPVENSVPPVASTEEPSIDTTTSNQAMGNLEDGTVNDDMSNISYDTKDNYNEFAEQKPKKKFPLTTIILVLLVLLVAAGGVYYFFVYKNQGGVINGSNNPVAAKELILELGEDIPSDITLYINRELKETEYKLDNKKIDNHTVGEYEFTVKYNGTDYVGKAIVKDTIAPIVSTKDVTVKDASSIVPGDFIESCTDVSGCSVVFASDVDTTSYTTDGEYTINIIASDDYDNKTNISAKLIVDGNASIVNTLTCVNEFMKNDEYNRKFVDKFVITYDDNNEIVSSVRTQISTMTDKTLYNKYKEDKKDVNTGTYDDDNMTYTEIINKTKDETLKSINSTETKKASHNSSLTANGYTCK